MKRLIPIALAALLGGCVTSPQDSVGPPAREMLVAVTADNKLIRFNGGQPQRIQSSLSLKGLRPGEQVLGIDFRVARNQLYLLASSGQLYRVKVDDASLEPIGTSVSLPSTVGTDGDWGLDFNPTVDRVRVTHESGLSLRRHPDNGLQVDGDAAKDGMQPDGSLVYEAGDAHAGQVARLGAVAYTYNKQDEKLTTNYAIDVARGLLVTMGSKEGVQPAISPNSGRVFTVGSLGLGSLAGAKGLRRVHFDISDVNNSAYLSAGDGDSDAIFRVDLASGKTTRIGRVGAGLQLRGIAIEP